MAYFIDDSTVIGAFQERDFKNTFQFTTADPNSYGSLLGYPYQIAVGCLGEKRFAKILKTVAYVIVDNDELNNPIVEKWNIKLFFKND